MKKIPITIPFIDNKDQMKVAQAIKYGWGDKCFENIKNFEKKFKKNINQNIHPQHLAAQVHYIWH